MIYKDGQVYIGPVNNTSEKLTVHGKAKITHLHTGKNLRQMIHSLVGEL